MDDNALLETITTLVGDMGLDETIAPSATINPLLTGTLSPDEDGLFPTMGLRDTQPEAEYQRALVDRQRERLGPLTLNPAALPTLNIMDGEAPAPARSGASADYSVYGTLGEGGMGVVQRAHQHSLQREVAFKRLKVEQHEDKHVHALLREAMFTGYLEHPNIIPVHQLGRDGHGLPAMVMKRVEGVSWGDLINDPHHPAWEQVTGDRLAWNLGVFLQICNALAFAHDKGVLHYDIKPENIMIGRFGEVYLLDWGIARRIGDPLPEKGGICGTPNYMAPEMIEHGSVDIGPWTDVYLLGATLHEVLVGAPRHMGDNIVKLFFAIATSKPHTYRPEVPAALAGICNRACHVEIAERYQSVEELRDAVRLFLRRRASMELTEAADECLGELLEMIVDGVEERGGQTLYQVFSECQFGFEQALKGWPENAQARDGLTEAITAMLNFELERDNLTAARSFAARLDPVPDDVAERIEALQRRLDGLERDRERLEALARDYDTNVGSSSRELAAKAMFVVFAGVATFMGVGPMVGLFEVVPEGEALLAGLVLLMSLVTVFIGRRSFLANAVNRHMAFSVVVIGASIFLNRASGVVLGRSVGVIYLNDMLIVMAGTALMGLMINKHAWATCTIVSIGFVVTVVLGEEVALISLPVVTVVAVVVAIALLQVRKRERQEEGAG